ncbi:MAG: peptide chain release factor N(5)-glutamine methyltransferase [Oligoflexales bacterium]|nr:peptide chain release factor N(5)-glutamine methyltransferase [Oligoflexales bacterium]
MQNQLDNQWTIKKLLPWSLEYLKKHQPESSRIDVEMLLTGTLNCPRINLYTEIDKPLLANELALFREKLKRRASGEPVAYILGEKAFMRHQFLVNKKVLIPRPETEILVETVLEELDHNGAAQVLDVGCGSGCISLSIAAARPLVKVEGWDISEAAIELSRENSVRLAIENCHFKACDALNPQTWKMQAMLFDYIVSNPPYISREEAQDLPRSVLNFEPHLALFAEEDGLAFYNVLAKNAGILLKQNGRLFVEIGYTQKKTVETIFQKNSWLLDKVVKDYSGHDRVLVFRIAEL